MEHEFRASSTVVKLGRWGWKRSFMPTMLKKIAKVINKQRNPAVFGCDTHFFYDLIPHLDERVKIIDLVHNFTSDDWSAGNYSIHLAERIHARVVLGKQNYNRFAELYRRHKKDTQLMDRVRIIHNQVKMPQAYPKKDYNGLLNVIFVARNCPDKRPQAFLDIAKACRERHLPLRFTMVGDFSAYMDQDTREVFMPGRITDKDELNDIYDGAHLILCTSRTEGFPMVFLEGMSRGVVPISTDVGEVKNYISERKQTGFVLDNHTEDKQIVSNFVELLTQICDNTKLIERFAANGYEMVSQQFSEAGFAENYRNLLALENLNPVKRLEPSTSKMPEVSMISV